MENGKLFNAPELSENEIAELKQKAKNARGNILKMTTISASGHPGGSMSSIDMYTLLWNCANVDPQNPLKEDRDRIVVSHGHTSPGVYSAMGEVDFFDVNEAVAHFRQTGSAFAGHVEQCVPGIEWDTGNLGQGLSTLVGFMLAGKVKNINFNGFCLMGDGEQQKGQIAEARRTAVKYGLNKLVAYIDYNLLQINGKIVEVMPQNIAENWASDGWKVVEVDAHDFQALYKATREALNAGDAPTVIMARSIMGKGVSFMENDHKWHGSTLSEEQCKEALKELGLEDNLDALKARRAEPQTMKMSDFHGRAPKIKINVGSPRTYGIDEKQDNRSGWGNAIEDIAKANSAEAGNTPAVVLDCDLMPSVKTAGFAKVTPDNFIQIGIQEHNAAAIVAAMSVEGVQAFFADFGVFGVDETYNQHRLATLNHSHPKIICTHCGLDVGEDGKTHQCVDYIGTFRNLLGFEVFVPADPNQTDRAVRYLAQTDKPSLLIMGRSKMNPVAAEDGTPFFGDDYKFEYGKADVIREGNDAAIITTGALCINAVEAHDLLKAEGKNVRVIQISTPLDIDIDVIKEAAETGVIVTAEDHVVTSGLGSLVTEILGANGIVCKIKKLGVTAFAGSGKPAELFAEYKLDAKGIAGTVSELMEG